MLDSVILVVGRESYRSHFFQFVVRHDMEQFIHPIRRGIFYEHIVYEIFMGNFTLGTINDHVIFGFRSLTPRPYDTYGNVVDEYFHNNISFAVAKNKLTGLKKRFFSFFIKYNFQNGGKPLQ